MLFDTLNIVSMLFIIENKRLNISINPNIIVKVENEFLIHTFIISNIFSGFMLFFLEKVFKFMLFSCIISKELFLKGIKEINKLAR